MSKLKKWVIVILLGLLVGGAISLSLCYMIIPERTKSAIDIVVGYLNTPYGLGCGITITGGMVIFLFSKYLIKFAISNSKYGKEELKKIEDSVKDYKDKASELKEIAEKSLEEQKVILSKYSQDIEYFTTSIIKVCETSPNAKIKAIGEELKGYKVKTSEELTEKLDDLHDSYLEIREKANNYQEQIDEIKELLKGVINNEREETLND